MNLLTTFTLGASATYFVDMYVATTNTLKLFFSIDTSATISNVELIQGMGTPYDDNVPYPWISAIPFAGQPGSHPTTQPTWNISGTSYSSSLSSVTSNRQTLNIPLDVSAMDNWLSCKLTGGNVSSTVRLFVEAP